MLEKAGCPSSRRLCKDDICWHCFGRARLELSNETPICTARLGASRCRLRQEQGPKGRKVAKALQLARSCFPKGTASASRPLARKPGACRPSEDANGAVPGIVRATLRDIRARVGSLCCGVVPGSCLAENRRGHAGAVCRGTEEGGCQCSVLLPLWRCRLGRLKWKMPRANRRKERESAGVRGGDQLPAAGQGGGGPERERDRRDRQQRRRGAAQLNAAAHVTRLPGPGPGLAGLELRNAELPPPASGWSRYFDPQSGSGSESTSSGGGNLAAVLCV